MGHFILGIDQGTTLTTALLCDEAFRVLSKASVPHKASYPQPGWTEHDPEELYANCLKASQEACAKAGITLQEVYALGLDHQGESCLIWEKESGRPIYPMIVWQDRRTAQEADRLAQEAGDLIFERSGMWPDAYYSATKLAWILDHVPGARERFGRGELLLGTFNTYFLWRASGGAVYATEPGSAGCTMLMNLQKTDWDPDLLALFGLEKAFMPEITDTDTDYGLTDPAAFGGARIHLGGFLTDSQAGVLGGGCLQEGVLKTSYGTGSFMLLQTGGKILTHPALTADCLWRFSGDARYALRGACYSAGSAIEWLIHGLGIISRPEETEEICLRTKDAGGVQFVPAFSGLASPYWDPYARGLLIGLTAGTGRDQIVRAVVESVACQVAVCFETMREAGAGDCKKMRADGGMTANRFIMQLQADLLGAAVEVPQEKEMAAFGSACLAGLSTGALASPDEIAEKVRIRAVYEPRISEEERKERLARFKEAVKRSLGWAKE